MATTPLFQFPYRRDDHAPTFEARQRFSLGQYFADLEKLFLQKDKNSIIRHGEINEAHTNDTPPITLLTDNEKKKIAVKYLYGEDRQYWIDIPEYSDDASWTQFKAEIYGLYPEAGNLQDKRVFAVVDVNALVNEWRMLGITSNDDLEEFCLPYKYITSRLIEVGKLCQLDQTRGFIEAFGSQPEVQKKILEFVERNVEGYFRGDPIDFYQLRKEAHWALSAHDPYFQWIFDEPPSALEETNQIMSPRMGNRDSKTLMNMRGLMRLLYTLEEANPN
ncbi:hypothetical protein DL96DRAFT_1691428 [Flagelloscypha sp. PMI_526]|nr:hypothetical protein DL96DRAFT_1691428 [Flagelloscypha sp. PMI_526]